LSTTSFSSEGLFERMSHSTVAASGGSYAAVPALPTLMLGAAGVVYGDIGTSPLYAMKEVFVGHHPLAVQQTNVFGALSLMVWSLLLIVTVKYVGIILRADNKGEGGSLALLALIQRSTALGRLGVLLTMLGIAATALFFGDAMITPAVSVLSAVEGLETVDARFTRFVIPAAIVILIGLFTIQRHGTDVVGRLFGPVMLFYFAVIAALGVSQIAQHPMVLQALNPLWAVRFFVADGVLAFLALGSVVLAVTGAEALYADMGHFGRKPITVAWLALVFPSLLLNYFGQAALMLRLPSAAANPFYLMVPESLRLAMVVLATLATIIASQAVITGAYSVVQQAIQLGLMPRIRIAHTSAHSAGQIYVPAINWMLMILVVLLVLGFRESSNLAAAYGIAVTGTMFITAIMLGILELKVWKWPLWLVGLEIGVFALIDGLYFASNLTKLLAGGWFPLLAGGIAFVVLTTWARGRQLMRARLSEGAVPLSIFIQSTGQSVYRVKGTSVFLASSAQGVPAALLHNLKHNQVLHDRVVILTVQVEDVPHVDPAARVEVHSEGQGFYRMILHYGFMEEVDIPRDLDTVDTCGAPFDMMKTSFFLGRQKVIASRHVRGMALWREALFAWMTKSSESAMEYFKLPTNRVVELGSQLAI
jgi:KUP system potassium uptake protein